MLRQSLLAALFVVAGLAGCLDSFDPGSDSQDPGGASSDPPPRHPAAPEPDGGSDQDPSDGGPGDSTPPPSPPPAAPREWGDASAATIRPGVQMFAEGQQCTSNFVFTDPTGSLVYLGFAAHCVADGEATGTNGCDIANEPFAYGTPVEIEGASQPGVLVYSAWAEMQGRNEPDPATCDYNDFAVVALDPADYGAAHPAMLTFGGPTAMAASASVGLGSKVITHGATGLRPGIDALDAREGYVFGGAGDGWSTIVYTVTPGLPGDSGSGVLTGDGQALGILVTVGLAPYTASNGVTSLDRALAYAESVGYPFRLATAEQISGGLLPSLL